MKILEKCKVIAAGTIVAALMAGTALPALAASPAGDVPFAVLAQQNSAVTPEQVEALMRLAVGMEGLMTVSLTNGATASSF